MARTSHRHRADLLVSLALVLLLGTFALAAVEAASDTANRIKCASNLRMIGQAMLLYSNENRGAFPRTGWNADKPTPTFGTPYGKAEKLPPPEKGDAASPFLEKKSKVLPAPNDVTAALYLLLRTEDISSSVFVCPSTGQTPLDFPKGKNPALGYSNFHGTNSLRDHLSYSMNNPYPSKDAVKAGWKWNNALSPDFPLAADMNPGTDVLTKLNPQSSPLALSLGNSINHDRNGQNVLYGDGHVEFQIDPFVGVDRDNLYTFGNSGAKFLKGDKSGGEGVAGPSVGPNDAVLLPTAKDLGIVDAQGAIAADVQQRRDAAALQAKVPAPAAGNVDAYRRKILGKYARDEAGQHLTLEVTPDAMIATAGPAGVAQTLGYKFDKVQDDRYATALISPTGLPAQLASLSIMPDGIYVYQGRNASGEWKRQ